MPFPIQHQPPRLHRSTQLISSINSIAAHCEATGADVQEVAAYWQLVVALNTWQQHRLSRLVVRRLFGSVTGKRIEVLDFALKADTNDTRETPAIRICRNLLEEGAQLAIFDPKVSPEQISVDLRVWAVGEGEG